MKKLKLLAIALCAVMALSAFAACGNDNKISSETLQLAVVNKGYGSAYAKELARAFKKKTGIDTQVVYDPPTDTFVLNTLKAGPGKNDYDIYFGGPVNFLFGVVAQGNNYVSGSDWKKTALADLSEIYDAPAVGFEESGPGITNRDIMNPYITDALTFHVDDKQYGVSYAQGMEGFLFNKTLWDETNAQLTGNDKLDLPLTTGEMFELFNKINSIPAAKRNSAFPFKHAGMADYSEMGWYNWWAQFDGQEICDLFLQGMDINGVYSPEIYNYDYSQHGRRYAYDVAKNLLSGGYSHNDDPKIDFITAQIEFLEKKAFFNFNGDWLEREAEGNFERGEVGAGFIRVPVISTITEKCDTVKTESKLREVIDYIDYLDGYKLGGYDRGVKTKPSGVSEDDFALLTAARHTVITQGMHGICTVPAYSKHLDEAKQFLKFMLSKEGQEIIMNACYGNMSPLVVKSSQMNYYQSPEITVMAKSRLEIFPQGVLFGRNAKYPMMYLGGMELMYGSYSTSFAGSGTVKEFMDTEYNAYKGATWTNMMSIAGVNNNP